ncbi:MAG TPA: N-acetylglucosamine-specific PTS transporter subunit IIBC [Candidatus Eisenbergiella pullistercoris]|uniref:N-acetylglucosamine-specific PTS transporter subunit IIBC n=1 Tax=Candidatus Eisenbergiella pullistercoris TaxID=2838555 RepID=A0A9D1YMD3_9FIRM|nr:N-acetylglucosamine-specific PTS transporter subunit IIBC [Candidatus Eisenbergiella pullistercoris]
MMKYLQKLGKSLMLPVACLPVAGILSGIGYLLCPAAMQGGEITGAAALIGYFMVQAALALVDGTTMAILFAVGVAVGMADDHDGTAGLAGLVSWLMMTKLLSTGVVTTLFPAIAENPSQTLAFDKIQNAFIGIIAGIIGSACYNKFKNTKLPDWLSFFSGKRCVAIITAGVSIIASAVLLFLWPIVFGALVKLGEAIVGMDAVGAGIYAFLNRLLIPTGLHHALNNVFWFDTIGIGDLSHFWAGDTSADVTWSLGMYMSGFFPCMMFGIPGAALAMVHTAKSNKKKAAIGIVASAAVCAFICGVTEPFEFAFMFLAPVLYLIYALLYGIFTFITVLLGFRAGFSFSAGATDLLFSASLPAAQNTWMIIPLGIAAFLVFYVVFRFAIVKLDLKTPGREDDDVEAEKSAVLANNDYTAVAKTVLEGLGGKENVTSLDNCITRLRMEIKDYTKVDEKKIKSAGVAGIIRPSKTSVQVIVGTKVQFVADEMKKLLK